jgi:hypothetical protein
MTRREEQGVTSSGNEGNDPQKAEGPSPCAGRKRKPYTTPRVTVYGTFEEITAAAGPPPAKSLGPSDGMFFKAPPGQIVS